MKLIIEVEFSNTSNPCNPCVRSELPSASTTTDDTSDNASASQQIEQAENSFDIRLLFLALALFSPVAVPIFCYMAWLYLMGSLQRATVADIWVWIAPLYAMTAALMIVATPVIERGVIRLYRSLRSEHQRR